MKRETFPRTAVKFDSHADSSRSSAVWQEPDGLGNHRRIKVTHLADVSVAVTLEQLQSYTYYTVTEICQTKNYSQLYQSCLLIYSVKHELNVHESNHQHNKITKHSLLPTVLKT